MIIIIVIIAFIYGRHNCYYPFSYHYRHYSYHYQSPIVFMMMTIITIGLIRFSTVPIVLNIILITGIILITLSVITISLWMGVTKKDLRLQQEFIFVFCSPPPCRRK